MTEFQIANKINRARPVELFTLAELLLRLPIQNTKEHEYFQQKIHAIKAGYAGEIRLDRTLEQLPMPKPHTFIPNFQMRSSYGSYYQMDMVIVTPKYVLLLEVKNIKGSIEFQENPAHIVRTVDGKQDKMDCPISQLHRNVQALQTILTPISTKIPIYSAIVFINSSSKVAAYPQTTTILYRKQLELYLAKLNKCNDILTVQEYKKLLKRFHSLNHSVTSQSLSLRFSISTETLRRGIFCAKCKSNLQYDKYSYFCQTCKTYDKTAMERSLLGLFSILGPRLSIKTLKTHLDVSSRTRIVYILKKMNCSREGNARASYYSLPLKT